MAALTGNSIKDTYIDLLQVSNGNSGIDGTRRNISDGEGTNAPITVSTSAAAFTGIADFTGGSPSFSNNQIPLASVDLSDNDTIEGALTMASGASLTFTSNSTLNLTDGTLTLANDQIPVAKIDQSGADTISGARTFTSAATFQATVDLTASTLALQNDQIPLAKVDLSDSDTITGALEVTTGGSLTFTTGSSLNVSGATLNIPGLLTAGTPVTINPYATSTSASSAHGLGGAPDLFKAQVTFLTTAAGYTTGTVLDVGASFTGDENATADRMFMVVPDATNLFVVTGAGGLTFIDRGTHAATTPSVATYRLDVTPYKVST